MRRRLAEVLSDLREFYGPPAKPIARKPFDQVLCMNVAYLADDERRAHAFALLRQLVGTKPEAILSAPQAELVKVTGHGILAETFTLKLRAAAKTAIQLGDLDVIARGPLAKARQALRRFPGIGTPGADKILLFSRAHAVPALDSNGIRVVQRLGLVAAEGSYAQVYRIAVEYVGGELGSHFDRLIDAYELLRRHGQELCRRSGPMCDRCPLRNGCAYYVRLQTG